MGYAGPMRLAKQEDRVTVDELASAERHAKALMASGVPGPLERTHLEQVCDRIEDAVKRKQEEAPIPIRRELT